MAASVCSDCLESDRIHEMDRKDWQGTLARPGMQGVQDVKEIRPAGQAGYWTNSIGRAGVVGRTSRGGKKERQASQGRQAG